VSAKKSKREGQNGKLKIELEFEDAVTAALKVTPEPKKGSKKRRGRSRDAPGASSSTD
jgi:hypothetical protein